MEKLIDLHTHTCYSDGELAPNELISLAIENNIGTLSITDHDTILGLKNINYGAYDFNNITLIPGIEFSAKAEKGQMHILGYGIDINDLELNNRLNSLKDTNKKYFLTLVEQLRKDYGINFTDEEIKILLNSKGNLGRPHIAKLLIKYGYVNSNQEAFDKYLIDIYNKVGYRVKGLDYTECINLILNSGGIPVLAHPKTLKLSQKELLILIKEMINNGLRGIEVYHSTHSVTEIKEYIDIANRYDLLISGGSDFHGPNCKPDIELGTGKNNLKIKKLSLLEKL